MSRYYMTQVCVCVCLCVHVCMCVYATVRDSQGRLSCDDVLLQWAFGTPVPSTNKMPLPRDS